MNRILRTNRLWRTSRFLRAKRAIRSTSGAGSPRPLARNAARMLLAALATLSLAACDAIPTAGPVREGLSSLDQVERSVLFTPSGPRQGASQEEIVRGFVRAALSSLNDYEVAREFLSPNYEEQWDPSLGVLVDDGRQQYTSTRDNVGVLSFGLVATVDAHGTLTTVEPGQSTEVPFELTKVAGEWRISSAPAGVILGKDTFTTTWVPRQLYFLNGEGRLASETHWFLNRPTLATQIVRELLRGPSEAMQGALRTAFPPGTVLSSSSVPVIDGTATVDVTAELFDADAATMDQIKRQLAASLQAVAGVTNYELAVQGTVIDGGAVASPEGTPPSEHQSVVVLKDGEFGVAAASDVEPIAGLGERVVALNPTAVTMATDRSAAAVLNASGVSWVSPEDTAPIVDGGQLLTPSLDPFGYVWVYDRTAPGSVTVRKPYSEPRTIDAPWLTGEPTALRISLGGNRIAVLLEDDDDTSVVWVAGIERTDTGEPVGFTETAPPQLWANGLPIDLDWISDNRFVALTETGPLGSSAKVQIGVVGQFSIESGAVASGTAISGGLSRQLVRVLDDKGSMFAPQGVVGWQQQQTGVDLIAKVG